MAIPTEAFTHLETELAAWVGLLFEVTAAEQPEDIASLLDGLENLIVQLEPISTVAHRSGLTDLRDSCRSLQHWLQVLKARHIPLSDDERDWLEQWPTLVMGYLDTPDDPVSCTALRTHVQALADLLTASPLMEPPAVTDTDQAADADPAVADHAITDQAVADQTIHIPNTDAVFTASLDDAQAIATQQTYDEAGSILATFEPSIALEKPSESAESEFAIPNKFPAPKPLAPAHEYIASEVMGLELKLIASETPTPRASHLSDDPVPTDTLADTPDTLELPPAADHRSTLQALLEQVVDLLLSDDTPSVSTRLHLYEQHIERIAEACRDAEWLGLENVCLIFQDKLRSRREEGGPLTEDEQIALETWPTLVMGYVDAPTDATTIHALLDHLKQLDHWGEPLPDDDVQTLRDILHHAVASPISLSPDEKIPLESVEEGIAFGVEEPQDVTVALHEPSLDFTADVDTYEVERASTNPSLDVPDLDAEDVLPTDAIEQSAAVPPVADIATDIATIHIPVDVSADTFSEQFSRQEADIPESEPVLEISEATDADLEPLEPQEVLQQELVQLMELLTDLLPTEDAPILQQVGGDFIARYSAQVERINNAAEAAGLLGLQNVGLLFQDALTRMGERDHALNDETRHLLEIWPALVLGYIESPNPQTSLALVEHLQNPLWPEPLTPDDGQTMVDLLLQNATEATDDTPASHSVLAELADDDAVAEAAAPDTMDTTELDDVAQAADEIPDKVTDEEVTDGIEAADEKTTEESAALSGATQELVEILSAEVEQMRETTLQILAALTTATSPQQRQDTWSGYIEEIGRLADAAEAIGFAGLHHACKQIHTNLTILAAQNRALKPDEQAIIEGWPVPMLQYLKALDKRAGQALVQYLQDARWPQPLAAHDAKILMDEVATPALPVIEEAEADTRQKIAQPEDVSLALPEDVNQELLDSLLQELPTQTAEFSEAIQRIIDGSGTLKDVDVAQRIAHTVKGAGNTVGVRGIAVLTHQIEDILLALSKHKQLPNRPLAETLMNAADCLEAMSEALLGLSAPPPQALAVLQEVLDWANRIDKQGIPRGDEDLVTRSATTAPAAPTTAITAEAPASAAPARDGTREGADEEHAVPMVRVPAPLIDELLRLVGESIILTGQIQERVRKTMQHARAVQLQNRSFQQLTAELEQLVDVRGVSSPLRKAEKRGDFDPLEMEQYNELNTVTHRLVEVATDSQELSHDVENHLDILDELLNAQNRLHRESQEAVLRTRMVPVKTIVPRLQRSVRQTCRLTDKEAELHVLGGDTLVDSNVLNDLTDPLMHLLRNAIDHGIEGSDIRAAKGKPPVGNIHLSFLREGNNIVVRCQDDGRGLDLEAIRRTAEQKGLINPDTLLDEDAISRMILLPNFSTRKEVTQTSGRGIGMDAVYSQVLKLKGSLTIRSKSNQGCLVEMRLPVTLISTHALLIRVRKHLYAVSDRGLEQILYSGLGEISQFGDKTIYQVGNDIYELNTLDELLNLPADRRGSERQARPLLLVRDETGTMRAVLVEQVVDSRDLVVKPFGEYVPPLPGIVGATILGDGSIAPVLDMPDLLRRATVTPYAQPAVMDRDELEETQRRRYALVVDDSLSARRALAQFAEDAGFEVRTARDGLEAADLIQAKKPDILLVDMEMPRMNGLELTSHIRAREETRHVPVIMITSRSTAKHQREAETAGVNVYLTKPFRDEELLGHINRMLAGDRV